MKLGMVIASAALILSSANALANNKNIGINAAAGYYDEKIIPANIKAECHQLGAQFSASVAKNLQAKGWNVITRRGEAARTKGKNLRLQINTAQSSGNAFVGHRKSVTVEAEFYQDGRLIDTFNATRNSGGGIGGGFKGSCAVLKRCVNTLGKDLSKWMGKKGY